MNSLVSPWSGFGVGTESTSTNKGSRCKVEFATYVAKAPDRVGRRQALRSRVKGNVSRKRHSRKHKVTAGDRESSKQGSKGIHSEPSTGQVFQLPGLIPHKEAHLEGDDVPDLPVTSRIRLTPPLDNQDLPKHIVLDYQSQKRAQPLRKLLTDSGKVEFTFSATPYRYKLNGGSTGITPSPSTESFSELRYNKPSNTRGSSQNGNIDTFSFTLSDPEKPSLSDFVHRLESDDNFYPSKSHISRNTQKVHAMKNSDRSNHNFLPVINLSSGLQNSDASENLINARRKHALGLRAHRTTDTNRKQTDYSVSGYISGKQIVESVDRSAPCKKPSRVPSPSAMGRQRAHEVTSSYGKETHYKISVNPEARGPYGHKQTSKDEDNDSYSPNNLQPQNIPDTPPAVSGTEEETVNTFESASDPSDNQKTKEIGRSGNDPPGESSLTSERTTIDGNSTVEVKSSNSAPSSTIRTAPVADSDDSFPRGEDLPRATKIVTSRSDASDLREGNRKVMDDTSDESQTIGPDSDQMTKGLLPIIDTRSNEDNVSTIDISVQDQVVPLPKISDTKQTVWTTPRPTQNKSKSVSFNFQGNSSKSTKPKSYSLKELSEFHSGTLPLSRETTLDRFWRTKIDANQRVIDIASYDDFERKSSKRGTSKIPKYGLIPFMISRKEYKNQLGNNSDDNHDSPDDDSASWSEETERCQIKQNSSES